MADFGRLTLVVDRWTPFVVTFRFWGIDLSAATMRSQVRLTADTPGAPLIDLPTVRTSNTEGLRILPTEMLRGIIVTPVLMRINEPTIEALPAPEERGDDLAIDWDLHITVSELKQRRLAGPFIVRAGVTQA